MERDKHSCTFPAFKHRISAHGAGSPSEAGGCPQVSDQARPQADKFNQQAIDPAARAVEQNARPMADKAIDKGIQPGAQVWPWKRQHSPCRAATRMA